MREIVMAESEDKEEILELYKIQLGREFCPWNDYYPSMETIEYDLSLDSLFVMKDNGKIIAAISHEHDEDCDNLSCWTIKPSGELARIAVLPEYQNQGIARELIKYGMDVLKSRGYKGIHFLVNSLNIKALRSYDKLKFNYVGECDMYNQHFYCYEKKLG